MEEITADPRIIHSYSMLGKNFHLRIAGKYDFRGKNESHHEMRSNDGPFMADCSEQCIGLEQFEHLFLFSTQFYDRPSPNGDGQVSH